MANEISLKNNTGSQTQIGYLVKMDTRASNAFIYCGIAPTDVLGVTTERTAPNAQCKIATMASGTTYVYVKGSIGIGDTVRASKGTEGAAIGIKALSSALPYFNIGTALEAGTNKLIKVSLNLYYLSGGSSSATGETFETVSKNLKNYPYTFTYNLGGDLTSIIYTTSSGTITKTLTLNGDGNVTKIVLSGATPSGITLTKTFTYSGDTLTGVSYS